MADPIDPRISRSRILLENPWAHVNDEGGFDYILPEADRTAYERLKDYQNPYVFAPGSILRGDFKPAGRSIRVRPSVDIRKISRARRSRGQISRQDIKTAVRNLQRELWLRCSELFPGRTFNDARDILDPSLAFEALGYKYEVVTSIGQHSQDGITFEVAGRIDPSQKSVQISHQFPPPVRRFTAAHELGHAVLHPDMDLHRDWPMDGARVGRSRNQTEFEADLFASSFLMPSKQMRKSFEDIFRTRQFELNERTAFYLNIGGYDSIKAKCQTVRDLSSILAGTKLYDGVHFESLAEQYGVSVWAMAIRLEELNLVRH